MDRFGKAFVLFETIPATRLDLDIEVIDSIRTEMLEYLISQERLSEIWFNYCYTGWATPPNNVVGPLFHKVNELHICIQQYLFWHNLFRRTVTLRKPAVLWNPFLSTADVFILQLESFWYIVNADWHSPSNNRIEPETLIHPYQTWWQFADAPKFAAP